MQIFKDKTLKTVLNVSKEFYYTSLEMYSFTFFLTILSMYSHFNVLENLIIIISQMLPRQFIISYTLTNIQH